MEQRLRDSLQEKSVLLKEVHHRVKSNLQIISGLLAIQSHQVQDPAMQAIYRESQNRLTTMALIHEKLYETDDLGRVEFAGYLRRLTEQVGLSHGASRRGIAVTVEGPPTPLSVDTALPCGLILYELLANAFRHGFPPGRTGRVTVTFAPAGGDPSPCGWPTTGWGSPRGSTWPKGSGWGFAW
jgi:two-component sensor histidine kinase